MWIPLFILIFGSIFVGYFFRDAFIGLGSDFWNNSIFTLPSHTYSLESEFLPVYIKLVPVIFSILGALISYYLYQNYNTAIMYFSTNKKIIVIYRFVAKRWYFDIVYNSYIVKNILNFSYKVSFKVLDRGFIEYIGPFGIAYILQKYSSDLAKVQSGNVYHYSFIMAISILSILVLITSVNYWWAIFPMFYYFLYFLFIIMFFSLVVIFFYINYKLNNELICNPLAQFCNYYYY
jgi:NADH-ubiquinone oxidoreductase chain 5